MKVALAPNDDRGAVGRGDMVATDSRWSSASMPRIEEESGKGHPRGANPESGTVHTGKVNTLSGPYASVSGGAENTAEGSWSWVGGGEKNTAKGSDSSITGGKGNVDEGIDSSVLGGSGCRAMGQNATLIGDTCRS